MFDVVRSESAQHSSLQFSLIAASLPCLEDGPGGDHDDEGQGDGGEGPHQAGHSVGLHTESDWSPGRLTAQQHRESSAQSSPDKYHVQSQSGTLSLSVRGDPSSVIVQSQLKWRQEILLEGEFWCLELWHERAGARSTLHCEPLTWSRTSSVPVWSSQVPGINADLFFILSFWEW